MRFIKIGFARNETVGSFRRSLKILSTCGRPSLVNAHPLIIIIVKQMLTGHPPKVEHGISLATEQEIVTVKLLATRSITIGNISAPLILELLPFKEILGIQFIDIEFSKGNGLLIVKHGVISADCFTVRHGLLKFTCGGVPVRQHDFTLAEFFKVKRALARIVCSIEHSRHGENFRDKEILALIDSPLTVNNLPAQVINQRLGNSDFLTLRALKISSIGQSGGFTIKNQIILPPTVETLTRKISHNKHPFCHRGLTSFPSRHNYNTIPIRRSQEVNSILPRLFRRLTSKHKKGERLTPLPRFSSFLLPYAFRLGQFSWPFPFPFSRRLPLCSYT